MRRLRADPPAELGGAAGDRPGGPGRGGASALPRADVLIFGLAGARVVLRPSGTEPKIKCYIEVVELLAGRSLPTARQSAAGRLAPLRHAATVMLAGA